MAAEHEEPPCPVPGGCEVCRTLPADGSVTVCRTCIACGKAIKCGNVICDECAALPRQQQDRPYKTGDVVRLVREVMSGQNIVRKGVVGTLFAGRGNTHVVKLETGQQLDVREADIEPVPKGDAS